MMNGMGYGYGMMMDDHDGHDHMMDGDGMDECPEDDFLLVGYTKEDGTPMTKGEFESMYACQCFLIPLFDKEDVTCADIGMFTESSCDPGAVGMTDDNGEPMTKPQTAMMLMMTNGLSCGS